VVLVADEEFVAKVESDQEKVDAAVLAVDEEPVVKVEFDQEKVDVVVSAVDEECCWRQSPQVHS
jgi:hypothetical protein